MIYVIVLTFQYLTGFSDIRLSGIEEHQELSYIKNIKDSFIQTFNTSNYSNNGDLNKIIKDINFTKNFFSQELMKKGINFDSKFIFFSNGFETGDTNLWTDKVGSPQVVSNVGLNGAYSLYSSGIQYVYEKLPGISEVYARVYVNFTLLPTNGNTHYFIGFYDHGTQILNLGLYNNNNDIRLRLSSFSQFDSSISINNSEWHYFDVYWYENGTNSIVKAWYDGNLQIPSEIVSSGGSGKSVDEYRVGAIAASGGTPSISIDCVAIGSDYIGDKCYPDKQNYFVFNLKNNEMETKTEFAYGEEYGVPAPTFDGVLWLKFNEGFVRDDDNDLNDAAWGDGGDDGANKWLIIDTNNIQGQYASLYVYGRAINCNSTASNDYRLRVNGDLAKTINFNWCDIFYLDSGSTLQNSNWQWVRFDIPKSWLIDGENKFNFWDADGACGWQCANWRIGVDTSNYYSRSGWCCNCGIGTPTDPPKGNTGTCGATTQGELMMYLSYTGNQTLDSSAYNNNGIIGRGISGDINASQFVNGAYGSALDFDGINDYVNIANSASLNPSVITLAAWVKANQAGCQKVITKQWDIYALDFGCGNGNLTFEFRNTSGTNDYNVMVSNFVTTPGYWHFVAVSYDGTLLNFYMDGQQEVHSFNRGTLKTSDTYDVSIGIRKLDGANPFNGTIDEVKMWSRALTAAEIQSEYSAAPSICSDGTPYDSCSATKPLYCSSGALIDGCGSPYNCGCPFGYTCQSDGTCADFIGNWKFNENLGIIAFDSSTYGNDGQIYGETFYDGTLGNGTAGTQPTRLSGSSCMYGSCLGFEGTPSVIADVVNATDIPSGSLTVMSWIYPKQISGDERTIVSKWSNAANDEWILRLSGGELDFYIVNSTYGSEEAKSSGAGITINTWQHVAITYDRPNKQVTFYVNGSQKDVKTFPYNGQMVDSSKIIRIGAQGGGTFDPFNGTIDEVRIWNRTLSSTEIQAEMTSPLPVSRPTASYSFEESGNYVNDTHIWVRGVYGSALSFDGVNDYAVVTASDSLNVSNITITAWIYPYTYGGTSLGSDYGRIVDKSGAYLFYIVNESGQNKSRFYYWNLTGVVGQPSSNSYSIQLNKWQHVAVVYDGLYSTFYVNGSSQGKFTWDATGPIMKNTNNLYVGNRAGNDRQFNGIIDELKIWNRTLSQAEILNCYQNGC
jgi:hypothetical protein